MADAVLQQFSWLTEVLQHPAIGDLPLDASERAVLDEFIRGWGVVDTAALLKGLSAKYGETAGEVIEKVLAKRIREDWAAVGARGAHEGSEIEDFIALLWEPLRKEGFELTYESKDGGVTFCVTKCPVHELAEKTGLHAWLYHLACATDFHTACSFSSKIEFGRTKTLMEGHDSCDHRYSYKQQ
jgi:predicted ArsR family transcriptional regulator